MRLAQDVRAARFRKREPFAAAVCGRALGVQFVAEPVKEHVDQENTAKQSEHR